jgi:hypothetical protein
MVKAAKNIYKLSEQDKEVVNDIITICVTKIFHFLTTHNRPKREIPDLLKTDKGLSICYFLLNAQNMCNSVYVQLIKYFLPKI